MMKKGLFLYMLLSLICASILPVQFVHTNHKPEKHKKVSTWKKAQRVMQKHKKKLVALGVGTLLFASMVLIAKRRGWGPFASSLSAEEQKHTFPQPTGKFAVETVLYHWIDTVRREKPPRKRGPRELMVQIWYPAQGIVPKKPLETYSKDYIDMIVHEFALNKSVQELEEQVLADLNENQEAHKKMTEDQMRERLIFTVKLTRKDEFDDAAFDNYVQSIKTKSKEQLLEALTRETRAFLEKSSAGVVKLKQNLDDGKKLEPVLTSYAKTVEQNNVSISPDEKQYPVIIFSHGRGMGRAFYSAYCQNLASHGYVVVSADHPYSAHRTVFPDGRTVKEDKAAYEKEGVLKMQIRERVADITFMLNQIEKLNAESDFFKGRLNLSKIGMFGHSLGALATLHSCYDEKRIKVGVSLDGPMFEQEEARGFSKPFLLMQAQDYSESWDDDELAKAGITREEFEQLAEELCGNISSKGKDAYQVMIEGTKHNVYSDNVLWQEILRKMAGINDINLGVGEVDGYQVTKRINNYLLAFFNKYLKDIDSATLYAGQIKKFEAR